jgi:glycosyltransferase involved in cell wall biosynthesis
VLNIDTSKALWVFCLKIFYSSEKTATPAVQAGNAHYSYQYAEDALMGLLHSAGYQTADVREPQNYKHPKAFRELLQCTPEEAVHIAFRSPENVRVMQGARNICHFAWEFEVMRDSGLVTESILENQVHMLSLMDEIWVACEFSRRVLQNYGLAQTFVVPAPVVDDNLPKRLSFKEALEPIDALPTLPFLLISGLSRELNSEIVTPLMQPLSDRRTIRDRVCGAGGRIFLAVLNPHDLRKNLLNLIEGFQIASDSLPSNDTLIIKLIVSNQGEFRNNGLFDHVMPQFHGSLSYQDPRIVIIMDYLSDEQMNALFCLADYYVSASHCEGFNRPLLQAMSFGTVPVSTQNTAMADYLDEANAIVISERRYVSPIAGMAGDVARVSYSIDFATRFDVAKALRAAMSQRDDQHAAMSEAARQTVLSRYGGKEILRLVQARLDAFAPTEASA